MKPPLTNEIASAVEKHFVGAISHADIDAEVGRTQLGRIDPTRTCGKASRLRAVLIWAIDHDVEAGKDLVDRLFSRVRGGRGFHAIGGADQDALRAAFGRAQCELTDEGEFRPLMLDNLSGRDLTVALKGYIQRAKAGHEDAALVASTGKDLLEAVAAHICGETQDTSRHPPFRKRLGNAFRRLGMAYEKHAGNPARSHVHNIERSMYNVAVEVNLLRNREGTGHGRPWPPNISVAEAKTATELMGVIAEYVLDRYDELNNQ